ncbi:MAG TPA: YetF domain-containing protein [Anaerolineales bacterium]|nr:YetF domain-containing protein [Anaerolineales bacterium]
MDVTFGSILIRATVLYFYALILIRVSGKQSISQLSSMDFVVAIILGNLFGTVIFGKASLPQAIVGIGTLIVVHMLVCYAGSKSRRIHYLVSPPPTLLAQKGKVRREGLLEEWMNMGALEMEMRLQGEDQLQDVKEAHLEPKGQLSILKNKPYKTLQKQDLDLLR